MGTHLPAALPGPHGSLAPAAPDLKSEPAIGAGIARATLPRGFRLDVVFLNAADPAERGLAHGDAVDIEAVAAHDHGAEPRVLRGLVAACYPEANGLAARADFDAQGGTPSYKSVPIAIRRPAG